MVLFPQCYYFNIAQISLTGFLIFDYVLAIVLALQVVRLYGRRMNSRQMLLMLLLWHVFSSEAIWQEDEQQLDATHASSVACVQQCGYMAGGGTVGGCYACFQCGLCAVVRLYGRRMNSRQMLLMLLVWPVCSNLALITPCTSHLAWVVLNFLE